MTALQQLKDLALQVNIKRFPNTPLHHQIIHPYHDRSERELERCIMDFCEFNGWQAERIKVKAIRKDNRVTYIDAAGKYKTIGTVEFFKSNMTPGSADMSATIMGRSVKIEIKIRKDTQKKEQKEYQQQIEKAGGIYIIIRTFEQFYTWYHEFIQDNAQRVAQR